MTPLTTLWLPILISAVFVFIASSIIHMAPLWHKGDYPGLPAEDAVTDALQPLNIPPGEYMLPRAKDMAEMKSAEYSERMKRGPVMMITVWPNGPVSMGRQLGLWFLYILVVSYFAAYVAGRALAPGTDYLEVFRFAGTTAFIAYSVALWQMAIWYRRSLSQTLKDTFDGLIYALLTAGAFGWLWPA